MNIFVSLLKHLHIPHTINFSNKYYNEHPNKYNLLGLSSMLSFYGIENSGVSVTDKNDIKKLDCPFIAHVGNGFALVKSVDNDKVFYFDENIHKNTSIPIDDFKNIWTGYSLIVEPNEKSQEPEYKKNRRKELINNLKILILVISFFFIVISFFIQNIKINSLTLRISVLVLSIIGSCICLLLVLKKLNLHRNYVDKICSSFMQNDCNNVLESKGSSFLGILEWDEVGLGFFISNVIVICLNPYLMDYLIVINFIGFPYTLWSLWYQKFKIRQWCPLCLFVIFSLLCIYIVCLFYHEWSFPFHFADFFLVSSIYLVFILSISLFIPIFQNSMEITNVKYEINHIKFDEYVFGVLLNKQPYYKGIESYSQILLGNRFSKNMITILINPHCTPCAKIHKQLNSLLERKSNVCIQYIFSSSYESLDISQKFLIATYLQEKSKTIEVYDEWFEYGKLDKEKFFKKYATIDIDDNRVLQEYSLHKQWIAESHLNVTPTILFNGHKLPDNYSIEDLDFLINLYWME
ncbi:vitamin K epoxide reductase family protein [Porphyromonas macacae]|uniref:vitamin K epoxide reductase family protein n=1 Tax=Porphyromonas macacae TaxID=28115 RepID=UPI0035A08D0E